MDFDKKKNSKVFSRTKCKAEVINTSLKMADPIWQTWKVKLHSIFMKIDIIRRFSERVSIKYNKLKTDTPKMADPKTRLFVFDMRIINPDSGSSPDNHSGRGTTWINTYGINVRVSHGKEKWLDLSREFPASPLRCCAFASFDLLPLCIRGARCLAIRLDDNYTTCLPPLCSWRADVVCVLSNHSLSCTK